MRRRSNHGARVYYKHIEETPHHSMRGTAIVSLDGSWSCPGNASGSRINHSLTCPDGRQTTFEEAFSKHRYYLTKSGTWTRTFHVAQVPIHRDISRDSDVQPILKNLVMPSSNYDGSEVVLFLDETSHNLRFISGPFPLREFVRVSCRFRIPYLLGLSLLEVPRWFRVPQET